jgi:hypothetical protein
MGSTTPFVLGGLGRHKSRRPRPLLLSPNDVSTLGDSGLGLTMERTPNGTAPRSRPQTADEIVHDFVMEEEFRSKLLDGHAAPPASPTASVPAAGSGAAASAQASFSASSSGMTTGALSGTGTSIGASVTSGTSSVPLSASIQRRRSELLRTLHSIPKAAVPRSSAKNGASAFFAMESPSLVGAGGVNTPCMRTVEEEFDEDMGLTAAEGEQGERDAMQHAAMIELMAKHRGHVLESAKGVKVSWFSFEASGLPTAAMENADPLLRALNAAESRLKERLVAAVEDRSRRSRRRQSSRMGGHGGSRHASRHASRGLSVGGDNDDDAGTGGRSRRLRSARRRHSRAPPPQPANSTAAGGAKQPPRASDALATSMQGGPSRSMGGGGVLPGALSTSIGDAVDTRTVAQNYLLPGSTHS